MPLKEFENFRYDCTGHSKPVNNLEGEPTMAKDLYDGVSCKKRGLKCYMHCMKQD